MDIATFNSAFATMSSRRPVSQTFTSNATVTFPAGVFQVDMTGFGARGSPASSGRVNQYTRNETYYGVRRTDGGYDVTGQRFNYQAYGNKPSNDYCDPPVPIEGGIYSAGQICYYNFIDNSYNFNNPATTGTSATGIGQTFPGSTGNVQQTAVGFSNVPVTAGTPYNLVIPSGGSITINYYA